jgi:uncharacterized repeat protein (TIGR03803 family)
MSTPKIRFFPLATAVLLIGFSSGCAGETYSNGLTSTGIGAMPPSYSRQTHVDRSSPTVSYVETVLHNFISSRPDPAGPLIQDSGGTIYGTTANAVYERGPKGTVSWLHTFGGAGDGSQPTSGVIESSSGDFFGTTRYGGLCSSCDNGYGTVFEILPSASGFSETIIHEFTAGNNGYGPTSGLVMDTSGNLYGVTTFGGSSACEQISESSGCGLVYKLTPKGSGYTLASFTGFRAGATDTGHTARSSSIRGGTCMEPRRPAG